MISRRTIRIKVLQTLYSYYKRSNISLQQVERELFYSTERTYDLFHLLLILLIDIADYAEQRLEMRKNRITASEEDKNPNMRFVKNRFIQAVRENKSIISFQNSKKLSWSQYPELIRKLHNDLVETEAFNEYMQQETDSFANDKRIVKFILSELFYNSEDLYENLEDQSIFWNDDIDYIIDMIVKNMNIFKQNQPERPIPPLFKNQDDKNFASELLRKTILKKTEYEELLHKHISNWDVDRIAFTDRLIMTMAVCEILEFPSIPQKVSFNEYIELAKRYGTERSSGFINGVLDKIVAQLIEENRINKTGRGLINE